MPSNYTGDGSGITAGQDTVIACPIDSDAPNANSVNVPLQVLANILDFLMNNAAVLGVANTFNPIQTFSNGIHCGGSLITGVVDPIDDSNAATKHYVDTRYRAATIHFSAAGPVVDRGPVTAAWVGSSPVSAVRITWTVPFASPPVVVATAQCSVASTAQLTVEVRAVSASSVDLQMRDSAGILQRLDFDGLDINVLNIVAMAP